MNSLTQTPEVKREVAYWNQQFDKCKSLREPFERQWLVNLAFYFGKQYVTWAPSGATLANQRLTEPAVPKNRVRITANKIKPVIRMELTKLTKSEPQFYAVPATVEPTDVAAAKIGESIIEYYMQELKYNAVRRRTTFWMILCGSSFKKMYTGATNGKTSIMLDALTPFTMYIPLIQEETVEKQPYVIHGRAMPVETVEATYNIKIDADTSVSAAPFEAKFNNALGIRTSETSIAKDMCFVKEIWVMPCKNYPNGAMLVIVGDQLLHVHKDPVIPEIDPLTGEEIMPMEGMLLERPQWSPADYPFSHGRYPFVKIDHIPAGRFYASSVIEDLIPLQVEYNKTRSQIVEAKNKMARPQMHYVKGSLDPSKVTNEPGQYIPINPGFEYPRPSELQPLPGYVLQELDRTLRDMDELSGQTEISKGRTPPGIEAASAIAYLQEENDSRLYHTVASIEDATVEIGKQLLALVHEFISQDEIVEIVSRNNTIEAEQFKTKNFKFSTDIRIESGSMAPKSAAARQAFITELMKLGIIPPEKGLRYLQMNETNRLYEELQVDSKAAQRENYLMSTGRGTVMGVDPETGQQMPQPMPVNIWDNHQVHEYEHGLFLKSQEYELIEDPAIKDLIVYHYTMHKQMQMQDQLINGGMQDVGPEPTDTQP